MEKLRAALCCFAVLVLSLAGCGVTIQKPRPGESVPVTPPYFSVPVEVSWGAEMRRGSFTAVLDGRDVTARFTIDDRAGQATASLPVFRNLQDHTLSVSAELRQVLHRSFSPRSATVRFRTETAR